MSPGQSRFKSGKNRAIGELWNDELELFAVGLIKAAVFKLLLARTAKAELEAWATLESTLGRDLIEGLGCEPDVIFSLIRARLQQRRRGREAK